MRQSHRASEKLFLDYARHTAAVIERTTGEIRQAQFYERSRVLWPAMAPKIFANAPRKLLTRKDQSPYAAQLRTLRNRVLHHEPVWHWPNLPAVVRETEIWLLWLNLDIARFHNLLDRFHNIHAAGPEGMPSIKAV